MYNIESSHEIFLSLVFDPYESDPDRRFSDIFPSKSFTRLQKVLKKYESSIGAKSLSNLFVLILLIYTFF